MHVVSHIEMIRSASHRLWQHRAQVVPYTAAHIYQRRVRTWPITLDAGDAAPDFELKDQDETTHRLKDYAGKTVVLYFYPRDDTPGCTKEACSFRDLKAEVEGEGAVVLGVSKDSIASHQKFRGKYGLNFPLLSDEGAKVASAYGTWGRRFSTGRPPSA